MHLLRFYLLTCTPRVHPLTEWTTPAGWYLF